MTEQNGFKASVHGINQGDDRSYLAYRIDQLERDKCDLERITGDLRIDKTQAESTINQMRATMERHERDIENIRAGQADIASNVTRQIDELRQTISMRVDSIQKTLSENLETVRVGLAEKIAITTSSNNRWFTTILVSLIASMIVIVVTRFV